MAKRCSDELVGQARALVDMGNSEWKQCARDGLNLGGEVCVEP